MTDADLRTVFERYLHATNARDVAALADLVYPDFEDVYPQSGETDSGHREPIEHDPGGGYLGAGTERVVGAEEAPARVRAGAIRSWVTISS